MRNKENAKYIKLGLTGAGVVAFGLLFFFLIYRNSLGVALAVLGRILRPFIIGAVLAYLVTPLSNGFVKRFGDKRMGLANAIALVIALVVVLAILLLIVPKLIDSVVEIAQALPGQVEQLGQKITALLEEKPDLQATVSPILDNLGGEVKGLFGSNGAKLADSALKVLGGAAGGVVSVVGVLVDLMIGVIVSLYFLSRRRQLAEQAKLILRGTFKKEWADWIESEVRFADRMFNGFFIGKLLDSAIVGAICFVGCLVMGFGSPLLIAVIVGVTNIIPFFGPYIGGGVSALLLLLENPTHCLMFLVFVMLLQQLDGNVIGPKILGDSTGLSALWVMFGILLFGGLWGIAGMLIGVPLMAVIYDIVRQITYRGVRGHGREDMIVSYEARFHTARKKAKNSGHGVGRGREKGDPQDGDSDG